MADFDPLDVNTWNLTCGWDNEPCSTRVMCSSGGCRRYELSKRAEGSVGGHHDTSLNPEAPQPTDQPIGPESP